MKSGEEANLLGAEQGHVSLGNIELNLLQHVDAV